MHFWRFAPLWASLSKPTRYKEFNAFCRCNRCQNQQSLKTFKFKSFAHLILRWKQDLFVMEEQSMFYIDMNNNDCVGKPLEPRPPLFWVNLPSQGLLAILWHLSDCFSPPPFWAWFKLIFQNTYLQTFPVLMNWHLCLPSWCGGEGVWSNLPLHCSLGTCQKDQKILIFFLRVTAFLIPLKFFCPTENIVFVACPDLDNFI